MRRPRMIHLHARSLRDLTAQLRPRHLLLLGYACPVLAWRGMRKRKRAGGYTF